MDTIKVELVKYDMDKTKKRKRANFTVRAQTEEAIIEKLERIHKGEKVEALHEVIWGEEIVDFKKEIEVFTGTVKFFDEEKGFGFIQPDSDMEDLFFHASALGGELVYDHDPVEFSTGKGPKGLVAIQIKKRD